MSKTMQGHRWPQRRLRPDVGDRQTSDAHHRLMPPLWGRGIINVNRWWRQMKGRPTSRQLCCWAPETFHFVAERIWDLCQWPTVRKHVCLSRRRRRRRCRSSSSSSSWNELKNVYLKNQNYKYKEDIITIKAGFTKWTHRSIIHGL